MLLIFLVCMGQGKTGSIVVMTALFSVLSVWILYIIIDKLMIKFSQCLRWGVLLAVMAAVYTIAAVKTPYSPAHDPYDMTGFLSQMLTKTGFSDYAKAYLSFTVTNRITMLIYYPFVWLFQSVKIGTQVLNYILILGGIVLISGCVRRMFGVRYGEISIVMSLPFVPYLMLSGPYIYPPSVFISALALFLWTGSGTLSRICSYVMFGILYILRPTALGFMLVFLITDGIFHMKNKKKMFDLFEHFVMILVFCILIKSMAGTILFRTGMHPYPKLTTSAMPWTLELGTRLQGEQTGTCTYSGYSQQPFDPISAQFGRLWKLYERQDAADSKEITAINQNIYADILERTKTTVLQDKKTAIYFLNMKYVNLFDDVYKPYYYANNITSEKFSETLTKNYEKRYFLYENVLLFVFHCFSAGILIYLAYCLIRRKEVTDGTKHACALIAGIIAVFLFFIMMTEVGKRLIFDVYVPMMILICYAGSICADYISKLTVSKDRKHSVLYGILFLVSFWSVQKYYSFYNITIFKNCSVQYGQNHIVLVFEQPVAEKGYSICESDGAAVALYGKKQVVLHCTKGDGSQIELHAGNEKYLITNDKQK